MNDVQIDATPEAESDLFSPEELALMMQASGSITDVVVHHHLDELQEQYRAVARLVAEGGEREREMRSMIHDLTAIANTCQLQQYALHEQTRNLAQLLIHADEREFQLKRCLEDVQTAMKRRAGRMT